MENNNPEFFYSPSNFGFYLLEMHGDNMPEDAVKLKEGEHAKAMAWQSQGGVIAGVSDEGEMILEDAAPLTDQQVSTEVLAQRDTLLREASVRIAPLQDAVDLDMASVEEKNSLTQWKQYRVLLNRIQDQPGFPRSFEWPTAPGA